MVLDLTGVENLLFPHSRAFDQGVGLIRKGAATLVVALDGSGDFDSIQAAIDALPTGGGIILIKEGSYESGATISVTTDNITIRGSGHSTIIKASSSVTHLFTVGANVDYFVLEDIQLDGTNATNYTLSFAGTATRSRVSSVWFSNWTPVGFQVWNGASFIIIENCIFESETTAVNNYAILVNASSYITIRGNLILGGTNIYGIQIYTGTTQHVDIVDNFIASSAIPISIIGTDGTTEQVVISNNFILTSTYGIYLDTADDIQIVGNQINSATAGIYFVQTNNYNCVSSNMFANCTYGAYLTAAASVQNTIFVGNTFDGNTTDIYNGGTNTEIGHNIF